MKTFAVGTFYDKVQDKDVRCIVVDGVPFGWGVMPDSLSRVRAAFEADPTIKDAVMMDMQHHFLTSLSKFVGRPMTMTEVLDGLEAGAIEV